MKEFTVNNYTLTRLWHCFGNHNHLASLDTIIGLLKASQTNVLPINTHRFKKVSDTEFLEVGYAGVPLTLLESHIDTSKLHKMLNINLQLTADDAVNKTKLAYDVTGIPLIKLEVLNPDLKNSNQEEIVNAVRILKKENSKLEVYPLFMNDLGTARKLVDLGSPLLRVMGSAIGACAGVPNMSTLEAICALGVPVILDGGIGNFEQVQQALDAGVTGVLINSMLFQQQIPPVEVMVDFARQFYPACVLLPETA